MPDTAKRAESTQRATSERALHAESFISSFDFYWIVMCFNLKDSFHCIHKISQLHVHYKLFQHLTFNPNPH